MGVRRDAPRNPRRVVPSFGRSGRQEAKPKPLICIECGAVGTGRAEGFKAYLADEDEVVVYCASCAEREFGDAEDDGSTP